MYSLFNKFNVCFDCLYKLNCWLSSKSICQISTDIINIYTSSNQIWSKAL